MSASRRVVGSAIRVFGFFLICSVCFAAAASQAQSGSSASQRVASILSKMTLEEKIDYIGGTGFAIRAMPNLHLYVSDTGASVPRPAKELKGFVKVNLKPGEAQHVSVPLDLRSLAYYDTDNSVWKAPAGTYKILVGSSSAQIDLTGELKLEKTVTEKP